MKKILSAFLVFLIIDSLIACSSQHSQIDIFRTSSCDLPCWNGIVLGKTTQSDLLLILNSLSVVNKESIGTITAGGIYESRVSFSVGVKGNDGQYPGFAFMYIRDGKVSDMTFVGGFELTIDEAISIFGMPEYVYSTYTNSGKLDLRLFMPKTGAIVTLTKKHNDDMVSGKDQIETLEVIDLDLYDERIQSVYTFGGQPLDFYKWEGFGNLFEKYPPR